MPYRFTEDDDRVDAGLRRIAREQIDKAMAEIDDDALPHAETVHQVRKRCKKLRGLIRLVRPVFDDYARENAAIRDAARTLSGLRDDDVLIGTFDALAAAGFDDMSAEDIGGVRERLVARRDTNRTLPGAPGADIELRLIRFREEMVAARKRVDRWRLSSKGFKALAGGLEKTYRRGRSAMRTVRDDPSPDNIHEWRKRVKYHCYHTRLLAPVWPPVMEVWIGETRRLSELLGDHNDLSVFAAALTEDFSLAGNPEIQEALLRRARTRQDALLGEALGAGARLFADRPEALGRRWRAHWKAWRKETRAVSEESALAAE
ncbi:MAG: CHAD domain-containing protein [Rhizobiaceae bacterium]|nr:CHAD domain-containing protein [Rhizobiaceae bacterium]